MCWWYGSSSTLFWVNRRKCICHWWMLAGHIATELINHNEFFLFKLSLKVFLFKPITEITVSTRILLFRKGNMNLVRYWFNLRFTSMIRFDKLNLEKLRYELTYSEISMVMILVWIEKISWQAIHYMMLFPPMKHFFS